mmetsp:Transcript_3334/g.6789  ORF Transcript_3334/g.6789 Transcript_3334/m.6789 type:complete len:268 (-) Transcript_3334:926-1729(-)
MHGCISLARRAPFFRFGILTTPRTTQRNATRCDAIPSTTQHINNTSTTKRNESQHPGETVATQAKRIGARWKLVAQSEKERLQALAREEKQRLAVELEAYRTKYGDAIEEHCGSNGNGKNSHHGGGDDLVFPLARIRKIAKLDPEVKTLSKEALQLVVKATEMALSKLGNECVKTARIRNRRTLLPEDVAHACKHGAFSFLKDDVGDLTKALAETADQKKREAAAAANGGAAPSKSETARREAASGSKPLTSYFGAAASSSSSKSKP